MPEGAVEWGLFLFFAGGALGGWFILFSLFYSAFLMRDK
jgi:hypothetical protein